VALMPQALGDAVMAAWCNVSWPWVGGPRRLSPQEFFSQRIAVGRT
jgi:hypothetical protein